MSVVEVDSSPEMADVEIFTDGGPWLKHNMPCPVCHNRPGVYDMNTGIIGPCWECHGKGYRIQRRGLLGMLL